MRSKLDPTKLASLPTVNNMLTSKYGVVGGINRIEFDTKYRAWYYAELKF